jgi:chromate transporter
MGLGRLILHFLRIGATGFGGPAALIALMHERLVDRDGSVDEEQFAEGVALGQLLPGPVAVDCATHIGYRLRGILGAIASTAGIVAPAFLLMLIMTPLYMRYGTLPGVQGFSHGAQAAVVAVIAAACCRLGQKGIKSTLGVVTAVVAFGLGVVGISPILLILAGGVSGVLFMRPRPEPEEAEP